MAGFVKDLIVVCLIGGAATALAPNSGTSGPRVLRFLSSVMIVSCAVLPLTSVFSDPAWITDFNDAAFEESGGEEDTDAETYGDAVLREAAREFSDHVRRVLSEKYGIVKDVRISVLFDDSDHENISLKEIQIFTGVRIDTYLDREAEDDLSRQLGCGVFIYSD